MKKLNNALNEVHDKYIDEAAKADRLQNSTARTVRNIAIPVASAAAVAGICLGLNGLGVLGDKPQGVDLLPADSGSSSYTSTTQTAPLEENDFTLPETPYLPAEIPLSLQTQSDIESIIFGSEFPEMLYADEEMAIFTEGIGGVYVFDFATEQITFAADIYDSLYLSVDEFDYTGEDSWNGVSIFALEDGTICCSLARQRFSTISSHTDYDYEFYVMDMENLTLTRGDDMHEYELDLYDGLFDVPYGEGYSAMSLKGARIGDTGEFVYIRNCTADVDLAPMYDMQYIELRRWTESEPADDIVNHMEGCWFPFDDPVGKETTVFSNYTTVEGDDVTQHTLYMNEVEFNFDTYAEFDRVPKGDVTVKGDIVKLVDTVSGFIWLYRAEDEELISLDVENQAEVAKNSVVTVFESERLVKLDYAIPMAEALDAAYTSAVTSYNEYVALYLSADNYADKKSAKNDVECCALVVIDIEELLEKAGRPVEESAIIKDLYEKSPLEGMTDMEELLERKAEYEQRIEELAAEIEDMKAYCASIEDQSELEFVEDDIEDANKLIADMEEDIASLSENHEAMEEILYYIERDIANLERVMYSMSRFEAENEAGERETAFVDYMCEYLGADIAKIGEAPDFGAILSNPQGITTYFGHDEWRGATHYGIDVKADGGEPIYAAADGVAYVPEKGSGWFNGYGNTVVIDHDGGWYTVYSQALDIVVSDGEKVTAGQEIAHVGSTGYSTGNHLHFEIRKGIEAIDPLDYISDYVQPLGSHDELTDIIAAADLYEYPDIPQLTPPIEMEQATLTERIYGRGGYYGHNGIDIASVIGAPVCAAADGAVIYADWLNGYGKCVIIQHDGYLTLYAHLNDIDEGIEAGQAVSAGGRIGFVGSTGASTGTHLHFVIITASDEVIDPTEYLPEFLNDVSVKYE